MKHSRCVLVTVLLLAGCVSVHVPLQSAWDSGAARRALQQGNNTIRGNAFMSNDGGGFRNCAGQTVDLIPATSYAIERMAVQYGPGETGFSVGQNIRFTPDPPEYHTMTRTTKCDSQGNFLFEAVADGEYFLTLYMQYADSGRRYTMKRVRVSGGRAVSVVVSVHLTDNRIDGWAYFGPDSKLKSPPRIPTDNFTSEASQQRFRQDGEAWKERLKEALEAAKDACARETGDSRTPGYGLGYTKAFVACLKAQGWLRGGGI